MCRAQRNITAQTQSRKTPSPTSFEQQPPKKQNIDVSKQHCRKGRRQPRDTLDDFPEHKEKRSPLELRLKQREAGKASSRSVYGFGHTCLPTALCLGCLFFTGRLADGLCTAALSMTSCTSFHHELVTGSQKIMIWIWFNDIFFLSIKVSKDIFGV